MPRPRPARLVRPSDLQTGEEFWARVYRYLAPQERALAVAFQKAIREAKSGARADRVAQLIQAGDYDRAITTLLGEATGDTTLFLGLRIAVAEVALETASTIAAGGLTLASVAPTVTLDTLAPTVVSAIRSATMSSVQDVSANSRAALRTMLHDAMVKGEHPYEAGRQMEDVLGLTDRDARALLAYRKELETQSVATRNRKLVDQRYAAGKKLAPEEIDRRVARYADRLLRHRAETVSITEAARAFNIGNHVAWTESARQMGLSASAVRRFWIVAPDERTCPLCQDIARVNAAGVGLTEPFQLPDGAGSILMPPAHPRCRCVITMDVNLTAVVHDRALARLMETAADE